MSREVGKAKWGEKPGGSLVYLFISFSWQLCSRQWWYLWINGMTSETNKFLQEKEFKRLEQFGAKKELL